MGKGQTHAHGVAKCPNCRGPHTEKPNLWPKEKEARRAAKGCRLCHHVAGSAAAPSQPTSLPQETATAGEEMEVEVQIPAQDGLYEMEE